MKRNRILNMVMAAGSVHDVRLHYIPFYFETCFPSAGGHCLYRWRRMSGDCRRLVLCMDD